MSNPNTTRIEDIDRIRTAYIMWREIPIATITEEYSSLSGEFDWVIRPIWENCEKVKKRGYLVDIAGIDIDLHKDEYIRRYVPYFVTQRVISERREDIRELLDALDMNGYDIYEIMCRSHAACGNDDYYVSRTPDKVIDVNDPNFPYDIPDFDTSTYGWIINTSK